MVRERFLFLDGLRGIALILMVLNHTARWWIDVSMGWPRYYLAYLSVTLPASIFLFLVGFCLPLGFRRDPAGSRPPFLVGLRRYTRRGLLIIGGGLLLNLVVFPEVPFWSGGVLQTIGLAIIVVAPALWLLDRPWARGGVLALAVGLYLGFALLQPGLTAWVKAHPLAAQVIFFEFPPWPWISPALVGLVLGWTWLEVRRRGAGAEARFFAVVAVAGASCLLAYLGHDWWREFAPRVSFKRDFILNRHWTPRGATLLLVGGGVALLLAGTWYLMTVRRWGLRWLVILGQAALMLYFLHQLIVLTLVNQALGLRFNHWGRYALANLALLVALVGVGWLWLALKRRASGLLVPSSVPAP